MGLTALDARAYGGEELTECSRLCPDALSASFVVTGGCYRVPLPLSSSYIGQPLLTSSKPETALLAYIFFSFIFVQNALFISQITG